MNGIDSNRPSLLYRIYESLTRKDPIQPADLIFVLAGRMERKSYGVELYRAGIAPRLLLSIGRFEVSKMHAVDAAGAAELVALRDRIPPPDRHFFCETNSRGTHIETAKLGRWSTYGELLGLRTFLERDLPRSLLVVSTDIHLRRVAMTFEHVFRGAPPFEVRYSAVPAGISSVKKDQWWTRGDDRRYVLKEVAKLAAYRAILSLPEWMIKPAMRLKS